MVAGGTWPPDTTLTKFYKCHPTTQIGAVVCILCGRVFHTKEIITKYNAGCPCEIHKQHAYNLPRPCQRSPNLKLAIWYFEVEAKELIAQVKLRRSSTYRPFWPKLPTNMTKNIIIMK